MATTQHTQEQQTLRLFWRFVGAILLVTAYVLGSVSIADASAVPAQPDTTWLDASADS